MVNSWLIGYGGMGRWHTEILSNVPEIEIGGIYDIKEEKRIEAKEILKNHRALEVDSKLMPFKDIITLIDEL